MSKLKLNVVIGDRGKSCAIHPLCFISNVVIWQLVSVYLVAQLNLLNKFQIDESMLLIKHNWCKGLC